MTYGCKQDLSAQLPAQHGQIPGSRMHQRLAEPRGPGTLSLSPINPRGRLDILPGPCEYAAWERTRRDAAVVQSAVPVGYVRVSRQRLAVALG